MMVVETMFNSIQLLGPPSRANNTTTHLRYDGGGDHIPELAHCRVHILHVDNLLIISKGDGRGALTFPAPLVVLDTHH